MAKQQIGVIGLAVMGKNLALNIESVDIPLPYITVHAKKQTSF
ncbi:6-phosphogluconate dehydrogenase, NADP(+)-dependent, decarboxylating [Anoxybacillus sp. BCO1]|nr:6-phosphogluconate dehydrogenase, NADP(+)-dependent, decarboxylating [Anoxybacillus sp. BCO1]